MRKLEKKPVENFFKNLPNFFIINIILASIFVMSNVSLLHQNIPLLRHIQIISYAFILWDLEIETLDNPIL